MPLKTNVGVSRKVADNNYGSRGASVNLEVELDSTLINDPERFHDRIRQVFRLAQQAIDEELNRQQPGGGTASHQTNDGGNGHAAQPSHNGNGVNNSQTNGHTSNGDGHRNGGGRAHQRSSLATPSSLPRASRASESESWKPSPRGCSTSRWRR